MSDDGSRADHSHAPPKRVLIKTFGCQMNVYDSERMSEALGAAGYAETDALEEADLVVLNTCHIREKAAEKVYSDLGRIRQARDERRRAGADMAVVVAGCVAQAEGAEIARRAPVVDLVVGPQSYHRLPDLVARTRIEGRIVETEFPAEDKFKALPERAKPRTPTAFLTVQEGCDKFCTFCVVPYTRGAEYSRPAAAIVAEAEKLVAGGVVELTLLGQNVNAYHGEGPDGRPWSLARLLRRLAEIAGLARLRYTTSHPRDLGDDLIAAHADLPQLMPYLHLPVQSGSDRILAAMNRRHTVGEYMELVGRIRAARPDIVLSTDIIVGFPGETEDDFAGTMSLIEQAGFAQAFSFKYSARPGTPAADRAGHIEETVKTERLGRLQNRLDAGQRVFNSSCVGRKLPVLMEKTGKRPGELVGRSPYLQPVHVAGGAEWLGRITDVEITAAGHYSLTGRIV